MSPRSVQHPPLAARGPLDGGHPGAPVDLRPPVAGAAREGLGEIGGLDVPVLGVEDGPDEALRLAERPDLPNLARGQELDADPDGAGDPGVEPVLVHAVAVRREADVADRAEADVLPRLALELGVQAHRVLVDLPDAVAHVEEGQEPRRVPGGAGGELGAFAQDHVRPALAGEVVEGRDADDAAADDDHPGMRLHGPTPAAEKWGGTVARFGARGKSRGIADSPFGVAAPTRERAEQGPRRPCVDPRLSASVIRNSGFNAPGPSNAHYSWRYDATRRFAPARSDCGTARVG